MDVRISRVSGVPLRIQVGRQIAMLIAAGVVKPGECLPSIRALANRLKIHYNTVSQAYQDLAAYHLVERRRGSRMVVPFPTKRFGPKARMDLDDAINAAIQLAQDHGHSFQQLARGIQKRLQAQPPDHLLVVANETGLPELVRAELEQEIACPVVSCSLSDLSTNPALAIGALVVGPPGDIQEITPLLPKDRPPYPITFNLADEHVALVRKLKEPSAIAVVSVSELFLQTARGLLAPLLARRHTLREFFVPSEVPDDLRAFSIVFCDSVTRRNVKGKNVVHYQLISQESIRHLAGAVVPK